MLLAITTAALHAAPACRTGAVPRAIQIRGTMTEGGSTGPFTTTIDLRNGYSRTTRIDGISTTIDGFDGEQWDYSNGIPNVVDVPTLLPDAAARAFVARLGWNDPAVRPARIARDGASVEREYDLPNASRVTVWSGPDMRRAQRAVVDADTGPETTTLGDWRCVAGIAYPFVQSVVDAMGESVATHVDAVTAARPDRRTFVAPARVAHGHIAASGPAPFRYVGKRDHHLIVDATVGTARMPLIFDTGGRNYFGPGGAKAAGLVVDGGLALSGIGSGSTVGGYSRIPQMSIANGVLQDEVGVVAPLPWPETNGAPGGSAGFEFLAEFRTTIDFPDQTIAFASFAEPLASGGSRVPLRSEGHFPIAQALVSGTPGWFGVDTGDSVGITLFKHFADATGIRPDPALPTTSARGVGGVEQLKSARLATFSIGGITVKNPRALMSDSTVGSFASRGLAGNLGNGVIGCFRVTFDYLQRIMVLYPDPSTGACLALLS